MLEVEQGLGMLVSGAEQDERRRMERQEQQPQCLG
jgi:hypothetical protein